MEQIINPELAASLLDKSCNFINSIKCKGCILEVSDGRCLKNLACKLNKAIEEWNDALSNQNELSVLYNLHHDVLPFTADGKIHDKYFYAILPEKIIDQFVNATCEAKLSHRISEKCESCPFAIKTSTGLCCIITDDYRKKNSVSIIMKNFPLSEMVLASSTQKN